MIFKIKSCTGQGEVNMNDEYKLTDTCLCKINSKRIYLSVYQDCEDCSDFIYFLVSHTVPISFRRGMLTPTEYRLRRTC
jgi:hypothetical protein